MDIFDEELLNFWKHFNQSNVSYIMIGEIAMSLYGYSRITDDIDIWIDNTTENRENVRTAFRKSGLGDHPTLKTMPIIPGWTDFRLNNGLRVDLMIGLKGLEGYTFAECLNMTSIAEIEGFKVPFFILTI